MGYGVAGLRRQWQALRRSSDPSRRSTLRVVATVNTIRWIVIAALFAAAFYLDLTCTTDGTHDPDRCMEYMLVIGTALISVTVASEIIGHRVVRREIAELVEDPPPPAPPTPLRIVRERDAEHGDD